MENSWLLVLISQTLWIFENIMKYKGAIYKEYPNI